MPRPSVLVRITRPGRPGSTGAPPVVDELDEHVGPDEVQRAARLVLCGNRPELAAPVVVRGWGRRTLRGNAPPVPRAASRRRSRRRARDLAGRCHPRRCTTARDVVEHRAEAVDGRAARAREQLLVDTPGGFVGQREPVDLAQPREARGHLVSQAAIPGQPLADVALGAPHADRSACPAASRAPAAPDASPHSCVAPTRRRG